MAGAAPVESGGGGRRPTNANLNLVPFIDLLSSLIAFLLMTAVWTQIDSLQSASAGAPSGGAPSQPSLDVGITQRGMWIDREGKRQEILWEDPQDLKDMLVTAREESGRRDAMVHADDDVAYDAVIRVLDACHGAGFASVALSSTP